jgi:electron transport complex protein RnfD
LSIIFNGIEVSALTGATYLESSQANLISSIWVNAGFLLGGVYLLARRVIFYQMPLAFLLAMALFSWFFGENIFFQLSSGATMLGAFFIITDPVSASTTPKGRLIYGFLIGVLVMVIRLFGNYPDGLAFAVLLLNIAVPLIDYYTQPKVFAR